MSERIRFDKWLWAARLFKTRSQATQAVSGGKARIDDQRTKPGAAIAVGDVVQVRKGPYQLELVVRELSERRGPAREAARLYEETPESRSARESLAAALDRRAAVVYEGKGRPTKRDRRRIERLVEEWPD